jgi:Glycosyltransferases involved in cell wall biogenesis
MFKPKISIITPTHQYHDNWGYVIKSVLNQTFTDWEWIILDSSEDKQICHHVNIVNNMNIKVIPILSNPNKHKIGLMKYVNCNLISSSSEIILELDHDDYLMDTALEKVYKAFQNPEVGFVYSDYIALNDNISRDHDYFNSIGCLYRYALNHIKYGVLDVNAFRTPEINIKHLELGIMPAHLRAWRKSIYEKIGCHDINLDVLDDLDLIIRTMLNTTSYQICEPLYIWNFHENSGTLNYNTGHQEQLKKQIINRYFDKLATTDLKVLKA